MKIVDTTDEFENLKSVIKKSTWIGFDLETSGLDPFTCDILLYQIGTKNEQYVVDIKKFPITLIKNELEQANFIGHNLKFDFKFLYKHNIVPKGKIWDTYIAEVILKNGFNVSHSLKNVLENRLNIKIDKEIRSQFINSKKITAAMLEYAANDVKYLRKLMCSQIKEARKLDLMLAIRLNNKFVPVLAYVEYSGIKLDEKKWEERIKKDIEELNNTKNKLLSTLLQYKKIPVQVDIFNNLSEVINWDSPKQVLELFKELGINVKDKDGKESVNSKIIIKSDHPIIEHYIKYKELKKRISTYGYNWFKYINPITKRIHSDYKQFVNTGRMSSGGVNGPNLQNIPADDDTRSCFVAEEGNTLIDVDYDSQEVRVFASFTQDPVLVNMYKNGYDDMHSYTAWHIYPHIKEKYPELNKETLKLIKENFPHERKISKLGNFAIQYGGTGYTVAENCNIPVEEGELFYKKYFETFKRVKKYFNWIINRSSIGYIQFNNVTKEKYFFTEFNEDVKRMCYNYPIQGTCASITKLAGILYWEHLIKENLVFKIKICTICHDEYLLECPIEIAEQESLAIKECMEKAGKYYVDIVPLTASPKITKFWKH